MGMLLEAKEDIHFWQILRVKKLFWGVLGLISIEI
jgi:hypothetical protein